MYTTRIQPAPLCNRFPLFKHVFTSWSWLAFKQTHSLDVHLCFEGICLFECLSVCAAVCVSVCVCVCVCVWFCVCVCSFVCVSGRGRGESEIYCFVLLFLMRHSHEFYR